MNKVATQNNIFQHNKFFQSKIFFHRFAQLGVQIMRMGDILRKTTVFYFSRAENYDFWPFLAKLR